MGGGLSRVRVLANGQAKGAAYCDKGVSGAEQRNLNDVVAHSRVDVPRGKARRWQRPHLCFDEASDKVLRQQRSRIPATLAQALLAVANTPVGNTLNVGSGKRVQEARWSFGLVMLRTLADSLHTCHEHAARVG